MSNARAEMAHAGEDLAPRRTSKPGDHHERQADEAARRALDGRAAAMPSGAEPPAAPPAGLGAGTPLPDGVRRDFEGRFGHSLERVRVHTDATADRAARAAGAQAFTAGSHIAFAAPAWAPETAGGRQVLAHELAHVLHHGHLDGHALRLADPSLDFEQIARAIHEAVEGPGTNETAIYHALQRLGRNRDNVAQLEQTYHRLFGVDLEDDLRGDLTPEEMEYALQLLRRGRRGTPQSLQAAPRTQAGYRAAARRIHQALQQPGTDEEAIYAILQPLGRDRTRVARLSRAYAELHHQPLRAALVADLEGRELDYTLYLMGEHGGGAEDMVSRDILDEIRRRAERAARTPPRLSASSRFFRQLASRLQPYLHNPSAARGRAAVDDIGRQMEGRVNAAGDVEIRAGGAFRPAADRWERGAIQHWNQQQIPEIPERVRNIPMFRPLAALPRQIGAATDVLRNENVRRLPYIDAPQLLGRPNTDRGTLEADVIGGGKNISQLMHWATGVRYADRDPNAMRDLFLAYEYWHMEGFDVFGQDAINDLIAEEQGRQLGRALLAGRRMRNRAQLLAFLNESFAEARAWVGALLDQRSADLDRWILAEANVPVPFHFQELGPRHRVWRHDTVRQQLRAGQGRRDILASPMVEAQIGIYTLIFESRRWQRTHGPAQVTPLQRALVSGRLNNLLRLMAMPSGLRSLRALGAADDLRRLERGD